MLLVLAERAMEKWRYEMTRRTRDQLGKRITIMSTLLEYFVRRTSRMDGIMNTLFSRSTLLHISLCILEAIPRFTI